MSGEHELNRDVDVDLGGIFASVWRNKFKILIFSLVVTVLTYLVLVMIPSRYRAETRILIQASDPVLSNRGADTTQSQNTVDDPGVASQVQLLQSQAIARKVIKELKLGDYNEFDSIKNPSVIARILSSLGLDDAPNSTPEDRILEEFYDRLKVSQAERSRVIVVQFWSNNKELAPKVANQIAAQYLKLQEEMKRGAGPEELDKLEPELEKLRLSVIEAERAVAEFRESSDLLQGRDNDTLATQELSEIATELGRVRAQLSQAEANADAVRRAVQNNALDTAASVLQSPLIQRLRERQVTLNAQLSDLSTTLLAQHPRIQSVRSQLTALDNEINREARKISNSMQQAVKVAQARERDLVQRRNELKSESGRVGRAQVELRGLEREADARRQLLNNYLVGFKEAKSRQNREFLPADAYVFSKARQQSKPYFPKKGPILAAAFIGSLLLGSVMTLAISVLTGQRVYDAEPAPQRQASAAVNETTHYQETSAYSQTAHNPNVDTRKVEQRGEQGQAFHEQHDTFAAERQNAQTMGQAVNAHTDYGHTSYGQGMYQQTATHSSPPLAPEFADDIYNIAHVPVMNSVKGVQTIAMLGRSMVAVLAPENDTSSEAALVLARGLASHSSSVIVLDMTGNSHSSKAMLGQGIFAGVKDLMIGSSTFANAIHKDRSSNAHIMPSGTVSAARAAGKAERLPTILDALNKTYEHVLIDCGEVNVSGLSHIANYASVTVIHAVNPSSSVVAQTVQQLEQTGMTTPFIVQVSAAERAKTQA